MLILVQDVYQPLGSASLRPRLRCETVQGDSALRQARNLTVTRPTGIAVAGDTVPTTFGEFYLQGFTLPPVVTPPNGARSPCVQSAWHDSA